MAELLGERSPLEIDVSDIEVLIENKQIRAFADGDTADLLIPAGNARRRQAGHTYDLDERYTRKLMKRPHAMIHANDAGGQRLAIRRKRQATYQAVASGQGSDVFAARHIPNADQFFPVTRRKSLTVWGKRRLSCISRPRSKGFSLPALTDWPPPKKHSCTS